jgi:predicted metal-dependent phosphoesterase TrpH
MKKCHISKSWFVLPVLGLLLCAFLPLSAEVPIFHREEIKIPDIPGYITLKCDLHMHTVFSDGVVWPTVRVDEAWSEGLDAISITDHIEYKPHKKDVNTNNNRSYEIALPRAKELSLLLIRGAEVTRSMPTGHYNAIFLEDITPLDQKDSLAALKAAVDQGAFISWNHPAWRNSDENGLAIWHPVQTTIRQKGLMHGIEVVNGRDYYPNAHRWALEKKLTMLGNTDIHQPKAVDYNPGEIRPLTLVFAGKKSVPAIKKALFDRRTAVYVEGNLYGEQRFLKPLFEEAVEVLTPLITLKGKQDRVSVRVRNYSDIPFRLVADGKVEGLDFPKNLTLVADAVVIMRVSASGDSLAPGTRMVELPYRVQNLHLGPEETLPVKLSIKVTVVPESEK